jgi:hypothetical protein
MPAGRPTKYREEYCQRLKDLMAQGYSFEAFAGEIGVSYRVIYTWADKHPEFMRAKKEGEAISRRFWERLGIAGAAGKLPGFNPATWIFNMKNRHKWRDRVEHSVDDERPIRLAYDPDKR